MDTVGVNCGIVLFMILCYIMYSLRCSFGLFNYFHKLTYGKSVLMMRMPGRLGSADG